ncbi:HAMP domain-containing histidine kinase, partial [bacterium]|nr:HAMP domain-containing histidine kinase [bacterium]
EFHLRPELGNLEDLTGEVVKLIEPLADDRGIKIKCNLRSMKAEFDPSKMRQALLNLLGNAVKYNREGGEIEVTLNKIGAEIFWSVQDTGPGIESVALKSIFERFYQVDKARTRTGRNGTGLGLPITKAIVEAHGGAISVVSEVGKGTTFQVKLPAG